LTLIYFIVCFVVKGYSLDSFVPYFPLCHWTYQMTIVLKLLSILGKYCF
jgi:hypothetical protein